MSVFELRLSFQMWGSRGAVSSVAGSWRRLLMGVLGAKTLKTISLFASEGQINSLA